MPLRGKPGDVMSRSVAKLVREMGTAFAVLAIYVLTLLAPLHQSAGLQRDLANLGYESIGTWSVCAPLTDEAGGETRDGQQIKCAAAGIGKNQLAATLPQPIVFDSPARSAEPHFVAFDTIGHSSHLPYIGQPRAPPARV